MLITSPGHLLPGTVANDAGKVSAGCGEDKSVRKYPLQESLKVQFSVTDVFLPTSQLQQGKGSGEEAYSGMVDCLRKIVRNEGYDMNHSLMNLHGRSP